jgi:hypothetical protein
MDQKVFVVFSELTPSTGWALPVLAKQPAIQDGYFA